MFEKGSFTLLNLGKQIMVVEQTSRAVIVNRNTVIEHINTCLKRIEYYTRTGNEQIVILRLHS